MRQIISVFIFLFTSLVCKSQSREEFISSVKNIVENDTNRVYAHNSDSLSMILNKCEFYMDTMNYQNNSKLLEAIDSFISKTDAAGSDYAADWSYDMFKRYTGEFHYFFLQTKNVNILAYVIEGFCIDYKNEGGGGFLSTIAKYHKGYSKAKNDALNQSIIKMYAIICKP